MPDEGDIFRAAKLMIFQHGDEAPIQENRTNRPSIGCGENSVSAMVVRGYDSHES